MNMKCSAVRDMHGHVVHCVREGEHIEHEGVWFEPGIGNGRTIFWGPDKGPTRLGPRHVSPVETETEHVFESGGKRSALKPRYDMIPQVALTRIAARYEIGLKYGEDNYKQGLPFNDTFNHIIDHLLAYKERRKQYEFLRYVKDPMTENVTLEQWMKNSETDGDDLAAAAWGCFTLMFLEENGKLS